MPPAEFRRTSIAQSCLYLRNKARFLHLKSLDDSDEEFTFNNDEGSQSAQMKEENDNNEDALNEIVEEMTEFTRVSADLNAINLFLLA